MKIFKIKNRFKVSIILMSFFVVFSIGAGLGYAFFFGSANVNLNKGLVGHWELDGNAKDATPNSNHGTVTEASLTTDRNGQANKAYLFDGVNDLITVSGTGSGAAVLRPTSITISAW